MFTWLTVAAVPVLVALLVRAVVMLVHDMSYDARRSIDQAQQTDLDDLEQWFALLRATDDKGR